MEGVSLQFASNKVQACEETSVTTLKGHLGARRLLAQSRLCSVIPCLKSKKGPSSFEASTYVESVECGRCSGEAPAATKLHSHAAACTGAVRWYRSIHHGLLV